MTEKPPLDPRLLKLVSAFAKADAIEDHERRLKGLSPLEADAPSPKQSRKDNDTKIKLNWHSVTKGDKSRS